MNTFMTAYHTDVGLQKKTNQDGLLLKSGTTTLGKVALFVICDGMGGLSQGELASATVIQRMNEWFVGDFQEVLHQENATTVIPIALEAFIQSCNKRIMEYGQAQRIQLGTTITALLIIENTYYLLQIGDSRAYKMTKSLQQLTKDQTLVAKEIEQGKLTEAQAKKDPRRHILLQCVGANNQLEPVITTGKVEKGTIFLLCTDGFYRQLAHEELEEQLVSVPFHSEKNMKLKLVEIIETVKERGEKDNISAIMIKV